MTLLEKFHQIKNETGLTVPVITRKLKNKGVLPTTARNYNDRIIYNVLHDLCNDDNVSDFLEAEYRKILSQNA